MLIPVFDAAGRQIAWIDHLKLDRGDLFRAGEQAFRLREDGALQEVEITALDPGGLIAVDDDDQAPQSGPSGSG